MKEEKNHIDYTLLGKYLDGETTASENKRVESWINLDAENKSEFLRVKKLWDQAPGIYPETKAPVDTNAAWEKVHGRISGRSPGEGESFTERESIKKTRRILYYVTRIAAIIVFVFALYILYNTYIKEPDLIDFVAENEIKETVLPDKSIVTLNENTSITYPEKFVRDTRIVELEGEAFFEVKRNIKKPFVIQVPNAFIEVLGTSFNVRAIEAEPEITVTVQDGKVKLSDKDDIAYIVLEKYEKGVFNKNTGHIEKYVSTDDSEIFWKTRTLIFRDTQLSKVFETLEKVYQVKINVQNEKVGECRLTAKFQDESIEKILENIAINFELVIQKHNTTFDIVGDGC